MASRTCSECGTSLAGKGPHAKTCSPNCRSKRSRRLKRQQKERGEERALPEAQKELSERIRGEQDDVLHKVIEEEVRPVVRESITEDTLKAIGNLVGLTPRAVAAIEDDLASDDATIRQRAYTLIMKYTVGHQAIVRPPDEDRSQPIVVNFDLPRPAYVEGDVDNSEPEHVDEAIVVKTCDVCGREAPSDEFAANSTRCLDCYAKQRARAEAFLKDHDGS